MTEERTAFGDDLPSDDVVAALRELDVPEDVAERHLARLATVRQNTGAVPPRRRTGVRAGAAGLVLGTTLLTGAGVAAAGSAQPGDALYGVKSARERIQLALARPGDSRAGLELKLARTRLGEAAALLRAGDSALAIETLARADAALASAGAHGGDDVDREVAGELDRRVEVLDALLDGGLPEQAADAAREAIERARDRGASGGAPRGNAPAHLRQEPAPARPDHPVFTPHPAEVRPASPPATRAAPPTARPSAPPAERPSGRRPAPGSQSPARPTRGR